MSLENVSDIYPLTPLQQGILFHCISRPEDSLYIDQVTADLNGTLDVPAFQNAWSLLAKSHAALRTEFLWDGLDQPLQVVRESVSMRWRQLNWSQKSEDEKQTLFSELRHQNRLNQSTRIDSANAPLLHFTLCKWSDNHCKLVICFHHLILDGWSMHLLLSEARNYYRQLVQGTEPSIESTINFRDYIQWQIEQQQEHEQTAKEHWAKQLGGFQSRNQLTRQFIVNEPAPVSSHQQASVKLSDKAHAAITKFARTNQLTLNTVVLGAWAILVGRYSNQADVVFGTTMAGRTHELPGVEKAVGMFINTLPLRIDADSRTPLTEWLKQIQHQQSEANRFGFSSLVSAQKCADLPAGDELFESIVVFENYPSDAAAADVENSGDGPDISIGNIRHYEQSNYPLALIVAPENEFELLLIHQTQTILLALAEQMLNHVAALIESIVSGKNQCAQDVSLLVDERQTTGEIELASNEKPFTAVHQLINEFGRTHSQQIAVTFQGTSLTYAELNEHADVVANVLIESGVQSSDRIGLFTEPSVEQIVGILGILKAGAAYVPLDPDYPDEHLAFVIADATIEIVLTNSELTAKANSLFEDSECKVVEIDLTIAEAVADQTPWPSISQEDLAYVIYTSGSSGKPKGVLVTHGNLWRSTLSRHEYYQRPVASFLLMSSFAFDSSVAGIFWTLTTGGKLVLTSRATKQDLQVLSTLVEQHSVTHTLCLPSLYRLLLSSGWVDQLRTLEFVIVAGEACHQDLVAEHFQRLPDTRLFNEYGPTESTVWSSVHEISESEINQPVSIGKPVPGLGILLLDQANRLVPAFVLGEVCVTGDAVAKGYLNLPKQTATRFVDIQVSNKPTRIYKTGDLAYRDQHGQLFFAGRVDGQVKVRGFRIETTGIVETIQQFPAIEEAAVKIWQQGTAQIAAYFTTRETGPDLENNLRDHLTRVLPKFMLPDHLVQLESFHRLANGKIDFHRLPEIQPLQTAPIKSPDNPMHQTMLEIWKHSTGCEQIGINDNFFSLGGDSIVGIQVVSRCRQAGIFFEPGQLARYPTIAELCSVANWQESGIPNSVVDHDQSSKKVERRPFPLSPIQNWFFEQEFPNPHHWNQSQLFVINESVQVEDVRTALEASVARHSMLRARFCKSRQSDSSQRAQWKQQIAPLDEFQLPFRSTTISSNELDSVLSKMQRELHLEDGPLLSATHLELSDIGKGGDRKLLLIVVHHLLIDTVSWRILIDELNNQIQAIRSRGNISEAGVADPVHSYWHHVDEMQNPKTVKRFCDDAVYWSRINRAPVLKELFGQRSAVADTEGDSVLLSHKIDPTTTSCLLTTANTSFHTEPLDLLLSAFAIAISRWTKQNRCFAELEFHGRQGHNNQADFSNTIGWFTASVPMLLELLDADDIAKSIKTIKEQVRELRKKCLSFGALRYQNSHQEIRQQMEGLPTPPILFNYLGQIPQATSQAALTPIAGADSTSRDQENRKTHPLELVLSVSNSVLWAEWRYSGNRFASEAISALADEFSNCVKLVAEFCMNASVNFTPSDFPEAGMTQEQLDDFLDGFD